MRYPAVYDWYDDLNGILDCAKVRETLETLKRGRDICCLELGCGNSSLGMQLVALMDFSRVVCVDFSSVVIEQMKSRVAQCPRIMLVQADARKMPFSDGVFDVSFEKGLLDAILCVGVTGGKKRVEEGRNAMREVWRVMRKGSILFSISHSGPQTRKKVFEPFFNIVSSESLSEDSKWTGKHRTHVIVLERKDEIDEDALKQHSPEEMQKKPMETKAAADSDDDVDEDEEILPNAFETGDVYENEAFDPTKG